MVGWWAAGLVLLLPASLLQSASLLQGLFIWFAGTRWSVGRICVRMWGWTHTYDCESELDCASETRQARARATECAIARERGRGRERAPVETNENSQLRCVATVSCHTAHRHVDSSVDVDVDVGTDNGTHMCVKAVGGGRQRGSEQPKDTKHTRSAVAAVAVVVASSATASASATASVAVHCPFLLTRSLTRTTLGTGISL